MVVTESEIGEVESTLQEVDQQQKNLNHPFSALGRQSSIYSLTLDEFQNTLCEGGKNFGSMNMDEFLTSIWNAEENQAINSNNHHHHHHHHQNDSTGNNNNNNSNNNKQASSSNVHLSSNFNETTSGGSGKGMIAKQPSLPRQGSLTLPAPLCRKTVDEVWSEIHRGQKGQGQQSNNTSSVQNVNVDDNAAAGAAPRQPTFGEMTLEDFLIKAGVVREQQCTPQSQSHSQSQPPPPPQQHPPAQYGLYQTGNNNPGFVSRPTMGSTGGFGGNPYQTMPPVGGVLGDSSGYVNDGKRGGGGVYQPAPLPPPTAVCYKGTPGAGGGGGYGPPGQAMGVVTPMSPVSSEGLCNNQVDNFGMEMGLLRGRKRMGDSPIEKVVERRQRRMIKNRESAARSRARKQAYTVELEAELNQLKQENSQLKQALAELERKRKQQYFEEWKMRSHTKAQKAKEKLRTIRRNLSCPL